MVINILLLFLLSIIIGVCVKRTLNSKKSITRYVLPVLVSIFAPIVASFILFINQSSFALSFNYYFDAIGTNILIFFTFRLVMEICSFKFVGTIAEKIYFAFVLLDTIITLLNPFWGHCFTIDKVDSNEVFVLHTYYDIHLIFLYMGVGLIIVMLARKLIITPTVNMRRYVYIFAMFIIVVMVQSLYILTDSTIDLSMFSYCFCAIYMYYFSVEYEPKPLIDKMKSIILSTMNDGILFFNENGSLIYTNYSAQFLLPFSLDDEEVVKKEFLVLLEETTESIAEVKDKEILTIIGEDVDQSVVELEYHKLYSKGLHIGSFIKIDNKTEEYKKLEEEYYKSRYDTLTGLYNSNSFYDMVSKSLNNTSDEFMAIAADIKEFKLVNDRYGRKEGDDILKKVANSLRALNGDKNIIGRIGVDKFAMLIRQCDYNEEALHNAISNISANRRDAAYPIIIHAGVYSITNKELVPSVIFDRAFMAITSIKNDLTRRVNWYDDSVRDNMLWELNITNDFDNAIQNNEIVPFLQAQVNTDGHIEGAEALVRWNHHEKGFLTPNRFINILEKNGYIAKLDSYIWEQACILLRKWKDVGKEDLYISVNISPKDFYLLDIPYELKRLVEKYEINPRNLRLEITETILMNDIDQKVKIIEELRSYGFIVEMDDFGSGYSSLNMFKNLPVDILKLDMVFINDKSNEEKNHRIMKLIIDMAKDLLIPVIAEGVEEEYQVKMLSDMGCDYFQGYYFSKPISVEEYENKVFN